MALLHAKRGAVLAFASVKDAPRKIEDLLGPPRNFRLAFEERLRAIVSGVPAYIRRKRLIEDLVDGKVQLLRELKAKGTIDADLLAKAEALDLRRINDLVDRHNRYYPVEANLPIDPKSGELLDRGQRWQPLDPVTPVGLLAKV
jgi:hypothetical protein